MGAFSTGVQAGAQTPVANPFGAILSRFNEAQARRMKEDDERKKEEFQLKKALEVLSKQNEYETSQKQEERSYEEGKQRREEGLEKRKSLFDAYTSGELNLSDEEAQGLLEEFGLSKGARPAQPAQRSVLPEVQGDKTQRLLELTGLSMPTKRQGVTSTAKGIVQQAGIAPRSRINESMANKEKRLRIQKLENELDPETKQKNVENKLKDKLREKELSKAAELLPKLDQATEAIKSLKAQYYRGDTPRSVKKGDILGGFLSRAAGVKQGAEAKLGANAELQTYINNRKAFASLISKGGFMESGVLTNQDINRVLDALPTSGSTKEEANANWREIEGILGSARSKYEAKLNGEDSAESQSEGKTSTGIKFKRKQ